MGLLLDTNVFIKFERRRMTASGVLRVLADVYPGVPLAASTLSVLELTYSIARATTDAHRLRHRAFLDGLYKAFELIPVTSEIAERAGLIEGQLAARGLAVDLADLLIGVTALQLGYAVLTHNVKHFEIIPGLEVVVPTFTL